MRREAKDEKGYQFLPLHCEGMWEGDVSDGLRVPTTYCPGMSRTTHLDYFNFFFFFWLIDFYIPFAVSKISKRLDLEPDTNKVREALSIPPEFREWHWLLSEYRMEECGLPPARDI